MVRNGLSKRLLSTESTVSRNLDKRTGRHTKTVPKDAGGPYSLDSNASNSSASDEIDNVLDGSGSA